jgi:Ca2+-binding RTX toxin-like protein
MVKRLIATLAITVVLVLSALPAFAVSAAGGPGNDTIYGTSAGEDIFGGSGQDVIFARGGNDVIHSGPGADSVWAGKGYDICYVGSNDLASGCEVTI